MVPRGVIYFIVDSPTSLILYPRFKWLLQALNMVGDMRMRLPRPAIFTAAYEKAYAEM